MEAAQEVLPGLLRQERPADQTDDGGFTFCELLQALLRSPYVHTVQLGQLQKVRSLVKRVLPEALALIAIKQVDGVLLSTFSLPGQR